MTQLIRWRAVLAPTGQPPTDGQPEFDPLVELSIGDTAKPLMHDDKPIGVVHEVYAGQGYLYAEGTIDADKHPSTIARMRTGQLIPTFYLSEFRALPGDGRDVIAYGHVQSVRVQPADASLWPGVTRFIFPDSSQESGNAGGLLADKLHAAGRELAAGLTEHGMRLIATTALGQIMAGLPEAAGGMIDALPVDDRYTLTEAAHTLFDLGMKTLPEHRDANAYSNTNGPAVDKETRESSEAAMQASAYMYLLRGRQHSANRSLDQASTEQYYRMRATAKLLISMIDERLPQEMPGLKPEQRPGTDKPTALTTAAAALRAAALGKPEVEGDAQ